LFEQHHEDIKGRYDMMIHDVVESGAHFSQQERTEYYAEWALADFKEKKAGPDIQECDVEELDLLSMADGGKNFKAYIEFLEQQELWVKESIIPKPEEKAEASEEKGEPRNGWYFVSTLIERVWRWTRWGSQ
jgi:hypothetical protein